MKKEKILKEIQTAVLMSGLLFCGNVFASLGATFGMEKPQNFPTTTVDIGRSISGIIAGVINLCSDGESKAQLIATQETTNKQADGTGDDETNAATTQAAVVEATALTNGAYDYINTKLFSAASPYQYDLLKNELGTSPTYDTAKAAVIKVLFADGENKDKEEYIKTIRSQRQDYAQKITKYQIQLASEVQKKIVADLNKAASAPVSSENEVGAMAVDGQTLDEMIKVELVDVALQIELMEADALAFMLHQRISMIDEPTK